MSHMKNLVRNGCDLLRENFFYSEFCLKFMGKYDVYFVINKIVNKFKQLLFSDVSLPEK